MAADATGIREYKGAAKATTLVSGITNSSPSYSIADSTGWPTGSVGNFVITHEQGLSTEERVLCSALAGGVLTVVQRGYDNTTAVAHAAGSSVAHTISAVDIAEGNYIANFRSVSTKATPVDADVLPLNDVAGGNVLKNLTWANLKATLKTYFDTLYARLNGPTVNNQTASYVLVASDVGKRVVMNSASATTITVNTSLFGASDTLEILNIGAGVCTITAGTATVSTAGTLALVQNAGGKLYFTSAGVSVFIPSDVASAAATSKVVQIVYANTNTYGATAGNTYVDSALTATITPTSASNKVLVFFSQNGCYKGTADTWHMIQLVRGATSLLVVADRGGNGLATTAINYGSVSGEYLDSPATTSPTTYKTQFQSGNNQSLVGVQHSAAYSTIVLMEVTP